MRRMCEFEKRHVREIERHERECKKERERERTSADEPESKRRCLQFVSANITVNEQLPRAGVRVYSLVV